MKPTTPGATRFIAQLLDYADRSEGRLPGKVTLNGYTTAEQQDVVAQIQRGHYVRAGQTIRVNVDLVINDRFQGDKAGFLQHLYRETGRQPDTSKAELQVQQQELRRFIEGEYHANPLVSNLKAASLAGSGWIGLSLRKNGLTKTKDRIAAFIALTQGLPSEEDVPLRSWCSRSLGNSHALDQDGILRGAFERYVLQRWPNHEDPEHSWLEAGILIGSARGLVQVFGTLTLRKATAELDLGRLSQAGHGVALERQFINGATIVTAPKRVTFIENPSTYTELRAKLPPGELLVLTDGFPNKAARALAHLLLESKVQVRHWGDIDPEGFRILHQLGRGVQPWLMDAATVNAAAGLTPFGDKEPAFRRRLADPLIHPEEREALQACLNRGGWLEQESIEIRPPSAQEPSH